MYSNIKVSHNGKELPKTCHSTLRPLKNMNIDFKKYSFFFYSSFECFLSYINKIQQDGTVCRYLFTAKSLYMFRVSIAPIIRIT